MPTQLFMLKALCGGVKARVLVNGVQVFRVAPGSTKSSKVEINPWIIEGSNDVELFMGPAQEVPSGANLDLKVLRSQPAGGGTARESKLATYRWDPARARLEPQVPLKVWKASFSVDKAFGRWSWEDAPKSPPTADDQRAIVALVAGLHQALSSKDGAAVLNQLEPKIDEMGRAFGVPADQMKEDQKAFLESLFGASDWSMEPLNTEGLVLVPAGDGRLYAVTDPTGKPPLRGVAEKKPILFSLTVSRVGGAWKVVR